MKTYCVYILCNKRNGTLYVGMTSDLIKRVYEHKNSLVDGFTRKHGVHCLIWYETHETPDAAILREKQIKKWRKENPDVEPATELLARIKVEKERLVKEKKIKQQKPLPPVGENEIPFELPEGWVWCRLGDVGIFERGKSKHRPRNDESLFAEGIYPFVQTGNVAQSKKNAYIINAYDKCYNKKGLAQSKMWPKGTLCITIAANIAETGFLGIDACFPDSVVGFKPLTDYSLSKFIRYFIDVMKTDIERFAPATAQKNINLGIIGDLPFPLPPEKETNYIINKVESLFTYCDKLEQQINKSQQDSELLMQAVLQEAFQVKTGVM